MKVTTGIRTLGIRSPNLAINPSALAKHKYVEFIFSRELVTTGIRTLRIRSPNLAINPSALAKHKYNEFIFSRELITRHKPFSTG